MIIIIIIIVIIIIIIMNLMERGMFPAGNRYLYHSVTLWVSN